MRIVFAGTPINAAKTLESLVIAGHTVVGVLTRADAPTGRNGLVTESPVAMAASSLGIPVMKSNQVDKSVLDWLSKLNPDLGVIVAYGCILASDALGIPKKGWVNLHYSLLPKYPGASPVQHALLAGETETGVTVFQLDEGVDTGPILATKQTGILPDENAGELLERLTGVGSELLGQSLSEFDKQHSSQKHQEIITDRFVTRRINRAMARLSFEVSAKEFVNKVRAMNPEPVAWCELDGVPIRVLEASISDLSELTPGMLKLVDSELVVGCLAGAVILKVLQPSGKKPMKGADWFRGLRRDSLFLS